MVASIFGAQCPHLQHLLLHRTDRSLRAWTLELTRLAFTDGASPSWGGIVRAPGSRVPRSLARFTLGKLSELDQLAARAIGGVACLRGLKPHGLPAYDWHVLARVASKRLATVQASAGPLFLAQLARVHVAVTACTNLMCATPFTLPVDVLVAAVACSPELDWGGPANADSVLLALFEEVEDALAPGDLAEPLLSDLVDLLVYSGRMRTDTATLPAKSAACNSSAQAGATVTCFLV